MNSDSFSRSFFQPQLFGVVDVNGIDAASFLHRMSTNNIQSLEVGSSCLTTFINQKARLIAACYVLRTENSAFRLVTPYASGEALIHWLEQYLFAEDATLEDVGKKFVLFWVVAENENGIKGPGFQIGNRSCPSVLRLCAPEEKTAVQLELQKNGLKELDASSFESLRIVAGVPFSTNEINEKFNPIQVGLEEAIHWAKGCYIGQEVISRLESKEKSAKAIRSISVSHENWKRLQQGESLSVNGTPVGTLSSVAPLHLAGYGNALAVFKKSPMPVQFKTDLSNVLIDSQKQGE